MPDEIELLDGFDYQGHLVFNGIYRTEFIDGEYRGGEDEARAKLQDQLPDYKPKDGQSKEGYTRINVSQEIYNDESVSEDLEDIAESLVSYRYQFENRSEEDAYFKGEQVQVQVPNVNNADIYWKYPNNIYLRGSKGDVKETREKTSRVLGGHVRLEPINFGGDFLLWLYYKAYTGQPIPGGLSIDTFTDSELTGDRDPFGQTNTVDDSTNLERCVPVISGVLMGKSISMLQGFFQLYGNYRVKAEIESDRVYVKASTGSISSSNDVRRIAISLSFLEELVDLYETWEQLPPTDKYPPLDFFEDIYQTAISQGVEINNISDDVLKKYANLRGENPDDWQS